MSNDFGWVERVFPGIARRRAASRLALRETELKHRVLDVRENLLDKFESDQQLLAAINPAAAKTRLTRDWPTALYSADQAVIPESPILIARARDAVRSDGIAASIVGAYRRNVIGIGITPRSNARDPDTGELLEDFNRERDRQFLEWANDVTLVDTERTKTFLGYERLTCDEYSTIGESFTILNFVPRADAVGLSVQVVEPEMLDTNLTQNPENKNAIKGGVEVDKLGGPVAIWVYAEEHPLEAWGIKSTRVTMDRVIHYFSPTRVRQTRALTPFAPILEKLRHLGMYDNYMLVRARVEACIGGFIEWDSDAPSSDLGNFGMGLDAEDTGLDANDNPKIVLEAGIMQPLQRGQHANFNQINTPGNTYDPFRRIQQSIIAAGVQLDAPTVMRDYTKGTFSSQMQGILENEKEFDPIQILFIELGFARIVKIWTTISILEGRLDAPNFGQSGRWRSAYLETAWGMPPRKWINPQQQAAAAKIKRELRSSNLRDDANQENKDWRDLIRQDLDEELFTQEERKRLGLAAPVAPAPVAPAPDSAPGNDEPNGNENEETE